MKKFRKVFFIILLSLFAILLITFSVVVFLVFTPERLTPIVRSQAGKIITCQSQIGEVGLTFFSTFPKFGVKIRQFALINLGPDSRFDTLVKADELIGVVDAGAWWKNGDLILTGLEIRGGSLNIYSDSLGKTNYDIFRSDTATIPESEPGSKTPFIDIRNVVLDDINLSYKDLSLKLNTDIRNLSARISGTMRDDNISGTVKVKRSIVSLEYDGEKYLQQAPVNLDFPVDFTISHQLMKLNNVRASVYDLEFFMDGTVEYISDGGKIITDLNYHFASWPLDKMRILIPPSYTSYFDGLEAEGSISSFGSIKGAISDSTMPVWDMQLKLEKGSMKYSGFPLPLSNMEGDAILSSDFLTDSTTYLQIDRLDARTPLSSFRVKGRVNHLFSDIFCDLSTTAKVTLDEFNSLVPDSLKIKLKGKASGNVKSAFSMTQMEKMQVEKMRLSGTLTVTDIDAAWDSLSLQTRHSGIDFSMPGYKPSSRKTRFATAAILAEDLRTGKTGGYSAALKNAAISIETSDVRDTTRIPDFICSFRMDSLSANMDTISIAIAKPYGKVVLSPGNPKPDQPHISISYSSDNLTTHFGTNSFTANKISFDADIRNDNTQKDLFRQWLIKGFIDMNRGTINMAGFSLPVEIPALKMNFDPETFNIRESSMKIGKSDFGLTGDLSNILSYFKGDSILRGKFKFISGTTDISQLMALTNGIGNKDSSSVQKTKAVKTDTIYTGPYMVPKGMDLVLDANINKATFGADTAANITGIVQVHDGVLVLDDLTFDTPAAKMQLTAMYRTSRKNHLFMGLDYRMADVEISELLTMIPDIDTLMPMLRSFGGKGEFHIAVETYMDSLYNIKKSTLRGAASIKGNDLILMDGPTFSEIAKTLRFNKKTENRVDTLSVEFTIFRNEIDVYPFLLVMDKYKAVIVGRHNFDMTFDYHISVTDCPLPIKLGIDIKGNEDNMSYKLAQCRYAHYYRPSARRVVESKRLELRKLIRDALTKKTSE